MLPLKVICIVLVIGAVDGNCSYTTWWDTFDYKGQAKCNEKNYYIRGLARFHLRKDDNLSGLEGADCCSAPSHWSNTDVLVVYEDWTLTLDDERVWARCPSGYFLQGLYRSDTGWPWYSGYLHNLETARCAKPATHPFYYGTCYVFDIPTFDRKATFSCREGYYITGLYKSGCDKLHCLDSLMCCAMAEKPQEINNIELLKSHIMNTNLGNMANLAHIMGYGWCLGNRGVNVGDDFVRVGDTWEATTKCFWPSSSCDGYKCGERLKIVYGNWSFEVKEIKYGEIITDDLQLESVDSGTVYNNFDRETTESIKKVKTVEETISHSITNSWTNSHEIGISLHFRIPFTSASSSISYTTKYESSSSVTNEKSTQTSNEFERSTSKTLPPYSSVNYRVMLSKSRTTIPYTAVIKLKFSVEFQGFLRWGKGLASPTTNYHYQYKGSGKRPTFMYRFGDASLPFYVALKKEMDYQSYPWLWNEMLRNYPSGHDIINRLTDQTQYEMTLSGILEHVRGTNINIIWENVTKSGPFLNDEMPHNPTVSSNDPVFALPGPNEHPVKVKFRKVHLANAKPFKLQTFKIDKDSV